MLKLYVGRKFTGITIEPDQIWPKMYRIRDKTGCSDMVNLTRAKDASISWARQAGFRVDLYYPPDWKHG